jgi:hypothetical protein
VLVSSHTISIWHQWNFASKEIQDAFSVHADDDLIVFVPKVVENGVHIPEFLTLLHVGDGVKLSHGTAYVGKGKIV